MKKIFNITLVALLVLVLSLSSCSKKKLKDVSFSNVPTSLYVGEEVEIKYELQDKASVEWSSSKVEVASVTNGKISALKEGQVTIKAVFTLGKSTKEYTFDITVKQSEFTVTYENDGSYLEETNVNKYSVLSLPIKLQNPTKDGYTFLGWYLNDVLVTEIPVGTTGDITLVAKWEENVVLPKTITYTLDGGKLPEGAPTSFMPGTVTTLPVPTKDGYTFLGWYINDTLVIEINEDITDSVTVVAKWEEIKVEPLKITYVLNGGKLPEDAPKEFLPGEVVTLPIPTRDKYEFLGWTTKLNSTNYITEISAETTTNVKYYANWERIEVYSAITYVLDGGRLPEQVAEEYLEGKGVELPIPTREGYNFLGWALTENANTYIKSIGANQEGPVTVYAKWELDTSFTITYIYEEGELPRRTPNNIDEVRAYVLESYYNWLKPSDDLATFKSKVIAQWKDKQSQGDYKFYKQGGKDQIDDTCFVNATENFKEWNEWFTVFDAQVTAANGAQNAWNSYVGILRFGQWLNGTPPVTWKESMDQALIDATKITIPLIEGYQLGDSIELVELVVDDGRTFLGWYDENGNKVEKITPDMNSDLTLTAMWSASTPADSFELTKVDKLGKLDSYQLTWVLLPEDTTNKKIIFTSSDPSILSIDKYAVMYGNEVGKVTVSYEVLANPALNGSFEVEVFVDPYIDATFDSTSVVGVGEYIQINAEVMAATGKVVWSSKDPSIAIVDDSGQVYGVKGGYVEIVASMEGRNDVELVLGITVITEEDKKLYSVLTNAHNAEVYYVDKLNVAYDYDTSVACSVSDLFFNWKYSVNEDYFIEPNRPKMTSIEFITVHYSGMPLSHQDGEIIAQAMYNGFHGTNWNGTSWHYSTGNDGIFHSMPDTEVAWHAGDGTGVKFQWLDTGVKATSNTKPVFKVVPNSSVKSGYSYSVNGQTTNIEAPGNYRLTFYGPTWKIENGKYYMGNTYYNSSYNYISSRGGNLNSIGIESACNLGSDLWMTYHITAQLVSRLLVQNNLETSRIQGHHTFSGKDCPQTLLEGEGELWYKFMELVEAELALYKTMSDYSIVSVSSNKDLVSDNGRVVKMPNYTETVTYTLTVKNNKTGVTKELKLSSVIHGLYTL